MLPGGMATIERDHMKGNREEQKPALRAGLGLREDFLHDLTFGITLMNVTNTKGQRVTYGALLPCGLPRYSLTFGVD